MFDFLILILFTAHATTGTMYLFSGVKSAFTVKSPVEGLLTNTLRFTSAITNVGGHYDTSTGLFTCEYPGIYVFTLNGLTKKKKWPCQL